MADKQDTITGIPDPGEEHQRDGVESSSLEQQEKARLLRFLYDTYTGSGGYEPWLGIHTAADGQSGDPLPDQTYLIKYPVERTEKWERRVKGAHYPNYVEWVVRIWTGLVTRETPTRQEYPDVVLDWLDHASRKGEPWDLVMQQEYIPWGLVYPEIYAIVMRDAGDPDAVSAAQAADEDVYAEYIDPQMVLAAPVDENGDLLYFKYVTSLPIDDNPLNSDQKPGKRIWVLTREGWWYYDIDGQKRTAMVQVTDSGYWDGMIAGRVPVATFSRGESAIYYIAQAMYRLYNVLSQKAGIEDGTCFPLLQVPVRGPEDIKDLKVGESSALPVPMEATRDLKFVGYDVAPIQHMTDEADRLVQVIKHLSTLVLEDAGATGIARAYGFLTTDRTIVSFVSTIEAFEYEVMELVAAWNSTEWPEEAKAGYPRSFDVVEVREALEAASMALDLELPETARREVTRQAIGKLLQEMPAELKSTIDQELDELAIGQGADQVEPIEEAGFGQGLPEVLKPDLEPR
jgi:hypothetical protein